MPRDPKLSIDIAAAARGQRRDTSRRDTQNSQTAEKEGANLEGETDVEPEDINDDEDELSSVPSIPDENIDFDFVYALHTFGATVEGQASVVRGEPLTLLDDSNSYWWLVKVLKSEEVGYIPAENVEMPQERLARLNKHRNVNLSSSQHHDTLPAVIPKAKPVAKARLNVSFGNTEDNVGPEQMVNVNFEREDQLIQTNVQWNQPIQMQQGTAQESQLQQENMQWGDQQQLLQGPMQPNIQWAEDQQRLQRETLDNNAAFQRTDDANRQIIQGQYVTNANNYSGYSNNNYRSPDNAPNQEIIDVVEQPSGETIKMTLTPSLGSDYIDFSDEENDTRKEVDKTNKFFFDEETRVKVPIEEYMKDLPPEDTKKAGKGKREKKEGIFTKLFSKKKQKVKKEEDQQKLVSSATSSVQVQGLPRADSRQGARLQPPSMQMQDQFQPSSQLQQYMAPKMQPQNVRNTPDPIKSISQVASDGASAPTSPLLHVLTVHPGNNIQTNVSYKTILLSRSTTVTELIKQSLTRFKLDNPVNWEDYFITVKEFDGEEIHLMPHDHPLEIFQTLVSASTMPLPQVNRESISSISSELSNDAVIRNLRLSEFLERNTVRFYLNRKNKRGSRSSGERRIRVHVLIYHDDLPSYLKKSSVPRVSMSVPKHLADKAARRRSPGEEGKPREKVLIFNGRVTVAEVITKALDKFGITDGIFDDGSHIADGDTRPRYNLMVFADGEERVLQTKTKIIDACPNQPDFRPQSVDSVDSNLSLTSDYRFEEPIFVLRMSNSDDYQRHAMPDSKSGPEPGKSEETLSRKQLIEQQREYSRAKQRSILAAHKNDAQGVDIVTSAGAIRSSRIFGQKVRYSFIPQQGGEEIDISDIIENIWGGEMDEQDNAESDEEIIQRNSESRDNTDEYIAPLSIQKRDVPNNRRASTRKSLTAETDILMETVDQAQGDNNRMSQSLEEKIERVLLTVAAGQYNNKIPESPTALSRQLSDRPKATAVQEHTRFRRLSQPHNGRSNSQTSLPPISTNINASVPTGMGSPKSKQSQGSSYSRSYKSNASRTRSGSVASTSSLNSAVSPTQSNMPGGPSSPGIASIAESDWVLSDDFGLQELLVLVRSSVNFVEMKERRRSGWKLQDDPEKFLEDINPNEFIDDIKTLYLSAESELDGLEKELDMLMDNALRVI
ncbi:5790_t:CDS:2 [Paraglomus occultum]|uniref:5790_t:CDS:1 n=1 Tax=Paraglomus occultum TaxID=144539 RepID=A0A9N9FFB9_9GLOM|nr:5790_t:CDS:2 [Paraglomus occultum]